MNVCFELKANSRMEAETEQSPETHSSTEIIGLSQRCRSQMAGFIQHMKHAIIIIIGRIVLLLTLQDPLQEEKETEANSLRKTIEDLNARVLEEQGQRVMLEERLNDLRQASARDRKDWKATEDSLKQQREDLRQQFEQESEKVMALEEELGTMNSRLRELEAKKTLEVQLEAMKFSQRIKDLEDERDFLKRLACDGRDPAIARGAINYRNGLETINPHSLIRPLASTKDKLEVTGLASLGNELFIASRNSSTIEVWNLETLCFKTRLFLSRLKAPTDLKQCSDTRRLYLVNEVCCDDGEGSCVNRNEILKVDTKGRLVECWPVNDALGNITVAKDRNVILAVSNKNEVHEFYNDGKLCRIVNLPWRTAIAHLTHAFKLTKNQFLICHGADGDALHRVCITDASGDVLRSYGKEWSRQELNCPVYLERDSGGKVLVVDGVNERVLALDSNLELMSVLISSSTYRRTNEVDSRAYSYRPRKICLDEEHSRLFVAEDVYHQENQTSPTLYKRILSSFLLSKSVFSRRLGYNS